MNKTYLVSFATPAFYDSQKKLGISALKHGVNKFIGYNEKLLKKSHFYKENKYIFSVDKGAGYWLWKPYIILKEMSSMGYGDSLIYADSGVEIIKSVDVLTDIAKKNGGIFLSRLHNLNRAWVKRDCFVLMNCDSEIYWNGYQVDASFLIFIKNNKNIDFLNEWLRYCRDSRVISDEPNVCGSGNFTDFKEHRHDQAVLSLLAIRHSIETFRNPSQWGNYLKMKEFRETGEFILGGVYSQQPCLNSPYSTILNHHRTRTPPPPSLMTRICRKLNVRQKCNYKKMAGANDAN